MQHEGQEFAYLASANIHLPLELDLVRERLSEQNWDLLRKDSRSGVGNRCWGGNLSDYYLEFLKNLPPGYRLQSKLLGCHPNSLLQVLLTSFGHSEHFHVFLKSSFHTAISTLWTMMRPHGMMPSTLLCLQTTFTFFQS